MKRILTIVFAIAVSSCGGDDEPEALNLPAVDCAQPVPPFAQVQAFTTCIVCHSQQKLGAARQGAPAGLNFDDYNAAKKYAAKAASEVYEDAMPPPTSNFPRVDPALKDQLYRWALCETPP